MPVTSRRLQVYQVPGGGKKAPTNLRWDVTKQTLINVECYCSVGTGPLPNPITIEYTVAGTYTDILPLLPAGYVWQITGILVSGGAGGGGGGGGTIIFGNFFPGAGGSANNTILSIPIPSIFSTFPGGSTITSVVGAGGLGGAGGEIDNPGGLGGFGFSTSINGFQSPPNFGGFGGDILGDSTGEPGGTESGSGGSGGNGSTNPGVPGQSGGSGRDGKIYFTATPTPE